jgi:hypothetical protein
MPRPYTGKPDSLGYRRSRQKNGVRKREHRTVWEANFGLIPKGHVIHHINGDKLYNRISNLQLMTKAEHQREHCHEIRNGMHKNKTLFGKRGVWKYKNVGSHKWRASIRTLRGKVLHLGVFKTKEAATRARMKAESEFYKEIK